MEALSEKGGFPDHDRISRTVRWGWTRALVQRPSPRSGDCRCGLARRFGHCRRRGGSAIVRGRGARWRYLPSDWLSRRESRAPRLGAAPEPVPGKPTMDFHFAATDMVAGRPTGAEAALR
jgi:hypothetical protein